MSTRNFVQDLEYSAAEGLDTTSPLAMMQPGFVREAVNCNLGLTGGYLKRDGFTTQLTTPWMGASLLSIRGGFQYRKTDGTVRSMLFGTNDTTDGRLGYASGGAVTNVLTGISPTLRVSFVQFEDRLLAFNGDSTSMPCLYFGGASTRSLGMAAPVAAPVLAPTTGGAKTVGTYIVAYTYIRKDDATGRLISESSPSPLSLITLSGLNNAINVPVVASTAPVLTGETRYIRIYCTVVSGSVLFLDRTDLTNATTTYLLTNSDAALDSIQMPIDNSALSDFGGYAKARFPIVARNRVFVAHESANEVRFTKLGQEGPLIESFPAINFASVESRYGGADRLVGLAELKGIPIVLKERSVGRLEEVGLPDITKAEDGVAYLYREISDSVGAVSHFLSAQVLDELVFLGRDNVYATDGGGVRPIANNIQSTIKALDFRDTKKFNMSMTNDVKNRRLYISAFALPTSAQPNLVLVGDYQQYPKFRWTFYGEGTNATTHPGLRPGSFFSLVNPDDGSLDVHAGNTDNNGQYYKLFDGQSDDTKAISFRLVSRPYAMQQPLLTKLFKTAKIFVQAANSSYSFEFCSSFDLSPTEEFCEDFSIDSVGNNWDENNWADDAETEADPLIWASSALVEVEYDFHRKAKFVQLVFKQEDEDAPITLLGWGVSGSLFGPI